MAVCCCCEAERSVIQQDGLLPRKDINGGAKMLSLTHTLHTTWMPE
jgi:hypothetical protein